LKENLKLTLCPFKPGEVKIFSSKTLPPLWLALGVA
jgi:hypothetical protein